MGDVLQVAKRTEEADEEQLQGAVAGRGGRRSKEPFGRASKGRWRPWAIAGASAVATVLLIVSIGFSVSYYEKLQAASEAKRTALVRQGGEANSAGQNATASSYEPSAAAQSEAALSPPAPSAPLIARSVAFVIVVKDVTAARPALDAILAKYHGYAAQMDVYTPADDTPSLKASLRIPVANLAAAMKDLRGLGGVASESESGEDVTQQHADVEQRLKTARDTEDRLRAILQQRTGTINDVLQVEEEMARVRGDIESMEAEQTNLEHRVDFASIDLSITAEPGPVSGSAGLSVRVDNAFAAGYRNAAGTVVGIFLFLLAYGLTIVIWLAILAVPVVLLRRRYRRIHAKL